MPNQNHWKYRLSSERLVGEKRGRHQEVLESPKVQKTVNLKSRGVSVMQSLGEEGGTKD